MDDADLAHGLVFDRDITGALVMPSAASRDAIRPPRTTTEVVMPEGAAPSAGEPAEGLVPA